MIYEPFNKTFWIIMLIFAGFLVLSIKWLKTKNRRFIRKYLIYYFVASVVIFFIYKIYLINDIEYIAIRKIDNESIFEDLPFYPCNTILWMMPIALITEKSGNKSANNKNNSLSVNAKSKLNWKEMLLEFCFFTALAAPQMALLFPAIGFTGYSILKPRMLGFVITHLMAISASVYLYFLDIYKPKFKDIPRFFVTTLTIAFIMHLVNIFIISTGLCENANYFFTIRPENQLLQDIYNFIPVPYLYMVPAFLGEALMALVITGMLATWKKIRHVNCDTQ